MRTWFCPRCGFWYDEREGASAAGIPPSTPWSSVPATWTCPDCGTPKHEVRFSIELHPDAGETLDARGPDHRRSAFGRWARRWLRRLLHGIPEMSIGAREQRLADRRPCNDGAASIPSRPS